MTKLLKNTNEDESNHEPVTREREKTDSMKQVNAPALGQAPA